MHASNTQLHDERTRGGELDVRNATCWQCVAHVHRRCIACWLCIRQLHDSYLCHKQRQDQGVPCWCTRQRQRQQRTRIARRYSSGNGYEYSGGASNRRVVECRKAASRATNMDVGTTSYVGRQPVTIPPPTLSFVAIRRRGTDRGVTAPSPALRGPQCGSPAATSTHARRCTTDCHMGAAQPSWK